MATREDWLEAGLDVLAAEGAPAVTIERLTASLGLSKGSYYHHFRGAGGFRTALLEHFEAKFTTRLIDTVEQEPEAPAGQKLSCLLNLVLADPDSAELELAVRAWALQDPEARATQERIDSRRTEYLRGLCRDLDQVDDPDRLARLLYLILIGAEQVLPALPPGELRDIYALVLRQATGMDLLT